MNAKDNPKDVYFKNAVNPSSTDIESVSDHLRNLSASERIKWASRMFDNGLFAMTSAGVDSALMMDHVAKSKIDIPFIHINTGFLHHETLEFRDYLMKLYGFKFYEFGPTEIQIKRLNDSKLWATNLDEYGLITKIEPLQAAIKKLKVKALLTGIRGDQTQNRTGINIISKGKDGELRINPFIDWTSSMVDNYIDGNKLPRNPLYYKGFGSVGDIHTTIPGKGRNGREVMECGLHMVNGKLVRQELK
jgi:phosphoadenosine phosphosulfate reductase